MKESGNYYYYQNDHLGTPQKIVRSNGEVVWSAKYKSFGEVIINMELVVSSLRFGGQYFDVETGLYYNYNRYYNIEVGRYLRVDPIRFGSGEPNLFIYVQNNPSGLVDPYGLIPRLLGSNPFWYYARGKAKEQISAAMPGLDKKTMNKMAETMADVVTTAEGLKADRLDKDRQKIFTDEKIMNFDFTCSEHQKLKEILEESNNIKDDLLKRLKKKAPDLPWDDGMKIAQDRLDQLEVLINVMEQHKDKLKGCD